MNRSDGGAGPRRSLVFLGSLLIVGPSFSEIGWWVAAPLMAATTAALRDIATRKLGAIDSGPSILLWTMLIATAGGFASLPVLGATPVSTESWVLLLGAGAMLALSNRLTIAAFKLASGALSSPRSNTCRSSGRQGLATSCGEKRRGCRK